MNLRISKAAAALFLSSLVFSACEDPTAIGLELQEPGTQIGTTYSDTATVKVSTVLLNDSVITLNSARVLVGSGSDATFGSLTAKTFAEFGIPTADIVFDANKGADSLVLRLDYDYYFGDTTQAITWNVYKLTEGFIDQRTYYTSSSLETSAEVLGTVTFRPRPKGTYVTLGATGDTLTRNNPYLVNIKLDKAPGVELANAILAQSGKEPLKTQQGFLDNLLKGLVIAPASTQNNGAVLGLNLNAVNTKLTLYYTATADSKPKEYSFIPTSRFFNQIQSSRAGTPLASLSAHGSSISSGAANNLAFMQAGAGLVTKIDLPYVTNFRTQNGVSKDLAVNKAELVIPILESSVANGNDSLKLPAIATVLESTLNNRISRTTGGVPNALVGEGTGAEARLEYRGKGKGYNYVVNITSYMQSLLYNRKANNGLILYPSNISATPSTPTNFAQTVNRAIIEANQGNTNPAARKVKLRIFYSTAQ
ncbi:hypothetical protein TH63_17455 [Rufibacter radiotolerans]|uniref:DUF4270 domain-containing protein n=1 Tax=Rufibacter radiotolerans TaxID=1379910 RepID=A0A0H4VNY7_9BACT|nr:DUF4270 family protein [Rufibacter radiotolerans]AKQ47023.1 hypothetical protein TH63_17455 [Rufibacter radiotolerans]